MNQVNLKPVRFLLIIFLLLNSFFLLGQEWLRKKGFDTDVLLIGNILLVLVMLISFLITRRSLSAKNPNAFVRAVMGSFVIKFFVIAIAAFVYIQLTKQHVNKPALFGCLGLYVLYAVLEVRALLSLLKRPANGKA